MKKLTTVLTVIMMSGVVLSACSEEEDMNEEFPGIEEPADPEVEEELDNGTDEE
ncbi:hypothetical protein SAMN04488102_11021 [Alkalibacterium subtropicum]|uniref:Secreted protein n=1 Tax=Alkalibacterium subtropicum TaxID=753702 RepID=A0A1I1KBH5_9LACT|nr:hypothetical protein [Alkalibacterium subtropicum]SFC54900.1 hypothetical protein SAMN04488102_11021 [Alkalibacterium subtropicum]